MTQNIYDQAGFFSAYSQLPRSVDGLDGAPEWPVIRAMLPPIAGSRVLDLGCGFGWFCRWAAGQGASVVRGIDVSSNMLARARAEDTPATITYEQADLEIFSPEHGAFDLAYSSLAFHYLADLGGLLRRVRASLGPGGRLVCSVEHPMMTAPHRQRWSEEADGLPGWPITGYLDEGARVSDWLAKGVVKQHRTIETYLTLLRTAGFALVDLKEWGPTAEHVAAHPDWIRELQRPPFLLLSAAAI